jgi:hypothetical protein
MDIRTDTTNLIVTFHNSVKALKTLLLSLRFGVYCKVPKDNLTLRWVSVTVVIGVNVVVAVFGWMMLVVAVSLILGAIKVSNNFHIVIDTVNLHHEGTYTGITMYSR